MRRTSVYTLRFDGALIELNLISRLADDFGIVVTGSGADPLPYVMFRAADDTVALSTARLLSLHKSGSPRVRNPTLTTGQGAHTRTINPEGTTMTKTATTYDVILTDGTGCGSRARKDAAIKLGDMQEQPYTIVSQPSGKVVHDSEATTQTPEAPAPVEQKEAKAPAKAPAPKKEKPVTKKTETPEVPETEEREGTELEFQGLGKYYARAAGLHGAERVGAVYGVEASIVGTTLTLFGSDEDIESVSEQLLALWPAAKEAHKEYRKNDATYSAISKDRKDKDANAARWELEVKWFQTFMDGAADELAGAAKKKGGAYKDGVNAVRNPAPVADADDVI